MARPSRHAKQFNLAPEVSPEADIETKPLPGEVLDIQRMRFRSQFAKTAMCRYFNLRGGCRNGESCLFAHGPHELQARPNLTKTALCRAWREAGGCSLSASDCPFAHGVEELRATATYRQTVLCPKFLHGMCTLGDLCRHAHIEMKQPVDSPLHSLDQSLDADPAEEMPMATHFDKVHVSVRKTADLHQAQRAEVARLELRLLLQNNAGLEEAMQKRAGCLRTRSAEQFHDETQEELLPPLATMRPGARRPTRGIARTAAARAPLVPGPLQEFPIRSPATSANVVPPDRGLCLNMLVTSPMDQRLACNQFPQDGLPTPAPVCAQPVSPQAVMPWIQGAMLPQPELGRPLQLSHMDTYQNGVEFARMLAEAMPDHYED
mmetsp:Transcript_117109/g.250232  ORF Transcript_117109/g.250232 Transcript_117109/m.250232 type:complete len:377 (-) Transcript_117109:255-1385(-)